MRKQDAELLAGVFTPAWSESDKGSGMGKFRAFRQLRLKEGGFVGEIIII
jgi:hypothetical protein